MTRRLLAVAAAWPPSSPAQVPPRPSRRSCGRSPRPACRCWSSAAPSSPATAPSATAAAARAWPRHAARRDGAHGGRAVAARRRPAGGGLLPAHRLHAAADPGEQPRAPPRRASATARSARWSPTSARSARARRSPRRTRERGNLADGLKLFTDHCAGCHQIVGEGGYVTGARVPPLERGDADAGRGGGAHRPVRDAAVLASGSQRPRARLDHRLRRTTRSSPTTRRLGAQPPRAVSRGLVTWRRRRRRSSRVRAHRREAEARREPGAWLLAALAARAGRAGRRAEPRAPRRSCRRARPTRAASCSSSACFSWRPLRRSGSSSPTRSTARHQTQLLGAALAAAFALLAAALIVDREAPRGHRGAGGGYPAPHPEEQQAVAQIVRESGRGSRASGCSARPAGAAGTLGLALVAPAASLGPAVRHGVRSTRTPWRRGRRLVDDARPAAARRRHRGEARSTPRSPRAPTGKSRRAARPRPARPGGAALPPERAAGRRRASSPTRRSARTPAARSRSTARRSSRRPSRSRRSCAPATTRRSTPPRGGDGHSSARPAAPLPQLPLMIDPRGVLRAAGTFSGPVGPSLVGRAPRRPMRATRRLVRLIDERTGRRAVRAQGAALPRSPTTGRSCSARSRSTAFIVLVATGVYLTLFFEPTARGRRLHGLYPPLQGQQMSEAYRSVLDISLRVKAGLLIRQTHHWAADVFVASIVLHLLRVFFTGAFRKPRELTYLARPAHAVRRAARGLPGLLPGRRPALGDGPGHRLLGRAVDPGRRRQPRPCWCGAARSRATRTSSRACTSATCCSSRR